MKVRLTEQQIEYIKKQVLNENYVNSSPESIQLANQLFHDPNNLTLWRCFGSQYEKSIFKYGMNSEYHDEGEGHYHGYGLYCFYEPYGCQKRVGTGGVGDKIMKGVLENGFKDFLIFDGKIAMKYYHSDDIRDQLNYLYDKEFANEVARIYRDGNNIRDRWGGTAFYHGKGDFKLHFNRDTAYLSKILWETFHLKLQGGKCRGIVYNGNQDPHACMIFNPKEFIPICVTKERHLNASGRDFDNWEVKVTEETLHFTHNFKDFFSIGEKLKADGLIKSYTPDPPKCGFLRVQLKNGKVSYYDIENKRLVSKVGFDTSISFEEYDDGTIAAQCLTKIGGKTLDFFVVPYEGNYYICRYDAATKTFKTMPKTDTTEKYDALLGQVLSKQPLNESRGYYPNQENVTKIMDFKSITNLNCYLTSVYHRTSNHESCLGICKYGFSPQYSNTECYGHGMYSTLSEYDSNHHLQGYGRYMIHAYSKEGFKNYVIFCEPLAKKYYGENWRVEDQLKLLIRPEYYQEIMSRHPSLAGDENIIATLESRGELGMTKIRGSIVWYGSCWIAVVCDWKSAIPYEYSTDDGATWIKTLDTESFKYVDEFQDGLFALQPFIADGIIKDTFGGSNGYRNYRDWSNNPDAHPQFINGYIRVRLSNGKVSFYSAEDKDLISYAGFDNALGWEYDNEGNLGLSCEISNGVFKGTFKILKDSGKYYFTKKAVEKDENGTPEIVDRVIEVSKANGSRLYLTTKIYDKVCGYTVTPQKRQVNNY